jgi:hypothetical protein
LTGVPQVILAIDAGLTEVVILWTRKDATALAVAVALALARVMAVAVAPA